MSNLLPVNRRKALLRFIETRSADPANPLNVVHALATQNGWPVEDTGGDEIVLLVRGSSTNYQISFSWMRLPELLHLACAFDLEVPALRRPELQQLIASINENLWFGHFDLWTPDNTVVFRQALLLGGGMTASAQQCQVMLGTGLEICERYFPAFRLVLANLSAVEAIAAVAAAGRP
jgi:hypothetical protein